MRPSKTKEKPDPWAHAIWVPNRPTLVPLTAGLSAASADKLGEKLARLLREHPDHYLYFSPQYQVIHTEKGGMEYSALVCLEPRIES